MKNIELVYENYHSLNEGKTNDVYYSLLDEIITSEEMDKLYPPNSSDEEIIYREPFQYLLLWDRLFYGNRVYDENKIWKDNSHKECFVNIIKSALACDLDEYLKHILFTVCYHWPEIRDLIYSTDRDALNECETADDYNNFIERHPNTYKEFLLAAKYKYSKLAKSVFSDVAEVLRLFPNSELIGVEEIKRRCNEINGLQVMYNDEVLQDDFLKDFLNSFIKSLAKVGDVGKESCRYILNRYITKEDYMRIMYSKEYLTVNSIVGNKSESQIGTFEEFTHLANRFIQMTGLKFAIPNIETLSISPKQPVILRKEYTEKKKTYIFSVNEIGEWGLDVTGPKIFLPTNRDYTLVDNQSFGVCRFIVEL